MKKQKKMTLISGIVALVFTFSILGTATYAWFTRGTTAEASGFDFTASTASGIQISTDALDWKSTITGADFLTGDETHPQYGNRITVGSMEPISAVNTNLTDGELNFFGATDTDGQYQLAADTANYLVFDLYFLNNGGEELTLSLTSNSTVVDDEENDKNTSLSTRVGFVVQGSSTIRETALGLAASTTGSAYIWEPNSLYRSSSAIGAPTNAIDNAKYAYEGIDTDNESGWITSNRSYLPTGIYTSPVTTSDIAIGDTPVVGALPANGNITKVKVFVWIEGQDIDCNNETSAGSVIAQLGFDSASSAGAAANELATRTVSAIVGDELTMLAGDTNAVSVVYNAFVFATGSTGTDTFEITYRQLVAQGTETETDPNITTITLDASVATPAGHIVVITAKLNGAIGSRSETTLE